MQQRGQKGIRELAPTADLVSKHLGPGPVAVQVELGAVSHPGKVRKNNEDHFMAVRRRRCREVLLTNLPEGYLPQTAEEAYVIVVADGMGGQAFGELASMLALRTGWDLGLTEMKWTLKVGEREMRDLREKGELYVQLIDQTLIKTAENMPETAGMGTTLTAAYTVGCQAFVFHVGDSRAYLFCEGELQRLTRDHTVAQQLVDAGVLSPEALAASSLRHVLTNCIGGSKEGVRVDVHHVELSDGDTLLLCTDGLTDMVDDEAISGTLALHVEPDEACRALLELALDRGGKDNVTAVVARYRISRLAEEQGRPGEATQA